jgi:predicted SAM-dependent methyltransferase
MKARLAINRAIKASFAALGLEVQRRRDPRDLLAQQRGLLDPREQAVRERRGAHLVNDGRDKVQYGSSNNLFGEGWVNVDIGHNAAANFVQADLTEKHPFPDACFRFGYGEDFLEHLDQEQSIRFLLEAHRTLRAGGVLRLSFPGLEGVLAKHYSPPTMDNARLAHIEAYDAYGHKHFYSREELRVVARHVGFREVGFSDYGQSPHAELRGLDQRPDQAGLNTYAELVK